MLTRKPRLILAASVTTALLMTAPMVRAQTINLNSLLTEMTDPDAMARFPQPFYQCLQASSYNRASTNRNQPNQDVTGWFADSDGVGFIRTETINGTPEWVLMEHQGPGCITKLWTPFFYYDFNDRVGTNIRIYLDGAETPVIDESLIKLVRGEGTFHPPLATPTARAGDSYVPIPFARSCKITMRRKPFYNIINYRAYPPGTPVETFSLANYAAATAELERAGRTLTTPPDAHIGTIKHSLQLQPGARLAATLPTGPMALRQFTVRLPDAINDPASLRATVLTLTFDGEETVWCPVGDFFCSADSLHPIQTWQRTVQADGTMVCRWVMPYQKSGQLRLINTGKEPVAVEVRADLERWDWDARSMHFHAKWRPDEIVPGTPFQDWNYIDIRGHGVYVGDAWTVLNIQGSWWGEGDEKIYVDEAWDRGFPTHFGTGTEDYYGWAGGVVPTRQDEFSVPFLANARVGGLDGHTTGFNICTRTRSLDAIPFIRRLRFDMESSFGTDIRNPWNLLGYSAVTFWYAKPGASDNRPARLEAAARPIMSLTGVQGQADAIHAPTKAISVLVPGSFEFESLKPTARSPGLQAGAQRPAEAFNPKQWSGEAHFFVGSKQVGDFVEFTFTEQFSTKTLTLYLTTSYDFGIATLSVNGKAAAKRVDLFSATPAVKAIDLGRQTPIENRFVIRCELAEPNARSRGARTFMGLDRIVFTQPDEARGKSPVGVFILAGQSNAEGHNHIRQYHDGRESFPAGLQAQPRILFWSGNDSPTTQENLWSPLRVGQTGDFGPEIGFAHDMQQAMPETTIAIVKYAAGGTGIARSRDYTDYIPALAGFNDHGRNWHPPTEGQEAGNLYRALIANVRSAMAALERDGKVGELAGLLWMQGEHEAGISQKMAEDYDKLLSEFVRSVRSDLHAPFLPFAIGEVNSHAWAYGDIARQRQREVCRKDPQVLLVKTVDLPRVTGDAAHFTADGMLTLGARFAEAMLTLAAKLPNPTNQIPIFKP